MEKTNSKNIKPKFAYYEDDYSREGKVLETKQLPEVNYVYKPLTAIQAANYAQLVASSDTIELAIHEHIRLVQKQVTSWDLIKPSGEVVDLKSWEQMTKVDAFVMQRICSEIKEKAGDFLSEDELKNLRGVSN